MASSKIEKDHVSKLAKLLSESGLVCVRQTDEAVEEEEQLEVVEEAAPEAIDEAGPQELEEENLHIKSEIIEEEEPQIFPTPSLRRVLPETTRKIEEHNRIQVLPDEFNKIIDLDAIPIIKSTPPNIYIDMLATLTGCSTYPSNLAEFWFLDTLANLLRRGQEDGMNKDAQALLILWFCEWMKEMQHFDAADRQRMLRRFKDNMLAAAKFVANNDRIPEPYEIGVSHLTNELPVKEEESNDEDNEKVEVVHEGTPYECSIRDLVYIIHYIFDLFSTDYQYQLVRSVFTFTPDYHRIDAPYQMQRPKPLFGTVPRPKPKKEPKVPSATKEAKGKNKKAEPPRAEYIRLMEMKAKEQLELLEQEEKDREAWYRRSTILPLQQAVTEKFFEIYWPPPTPEPVIEVVVEPKGKKKKGK